MTKAGSGAAGQRRRLGRRNRDDDPERVVVEGGLDEKNTCMPRSSDQPILLNAFISSMLAMKHLVSTDAASLCALVMISVISLALAMAVS